MYTITYIQNIKTYTLHNLNFQALEIIINDLGSSKLETLYLTNSGILTRVLGILPIHSFFKNLKVILPNNIICIVNIDDHIPSMFTALHLNIEHLIYNSLPKSAINICNKYKVQIYKV